MIPFVNRVEFVSTTSGTSDFGVGAAVTGNRTPASAGVQNGQVVVYTAESSDKTQWELGVGTYNSSGPTLVRTFVRETDDSSSKRNFTAAPNVFLDFQALDVRDGLAVSSMYGGL